MKTNELNIDTIEFGTINDMVEELEANKIMNNGGTQCDGTHYSTKITPIEYILANKLGFCEGNVVKYITRYQDKNGARDLIKTVTYCQFLLQNTYNISSDFITSDGGKYHTDSKNLRDFQNNEE